jgi:hypothetical protein
VRQGQGADLPRRGAEGPDRRQPRPHPDRQGLGRRQRQDAGEGLRRGGLGGRASPAPDGKLPPVGSTVDVANATWTNTIGAPELITVWKDPEFDPRQRAFYYARVLEIPTPRWTAYDAKRFGTKPLPGTTMTLQERAYTSPIWYTPRPASVNAPPPGAAAAPRAARWLREPILHFLLIGAALFVLYGRVAPDGGDGDTRIVVTRAIADELARQHAARWSRPPTADELATLVEAWVRDEVLYREGVALGLDRDDPVIKRRVRQKVELMAEELLASDAPTDAQLAAYMAKHPDRFVRPARIDFEQVFFDGTRAQAEVERDVADARDALSRGADPDGLGQPTLLPRRIVDMPVDIVARDFGAAFAAQVAALPVGRWSGPLRSGFGVHLVRVGALAPAALPPLDAVRTLVAREWENERRLLSAAQGYERMRARYRIDVEPGLPAPAPHGARKP